MGKKQRRERSIDGTLIRPFRWSTQRLWRGMFVTPQAFTVFKNVFSTLFLNLSKSYHLQAYHSMES